MEYEFSSKKYKVFLWFVLITVLIFDFASYYTIIREQIVLGGFGYYFGILGILLKLSLLGVLLIKKGPVKGLIFTWGGLFIFGASAGLLSLAINYFLNGEFEISAWIEKAIFLLIGLLLVIPCHKTVTYRKENA